MVVCSGYGDVRRSCRVGLPPPARLAMLTLLSLLLWCTINDGITVAAAAVAPSGPTATPADAARLRDGTSGNATATAYLRRCPDDAPASDAAALHGCGLQLVVDVLLDDSTLAGSVLETNVTVTSAVHQGLFPAALSDQSTSDSGSAAATSLQVTLPPITIAVERGAVQVRYGLTHLRRFPAALRDKVQVLRTAMSCDDGVTRCPSYTNAAGALVPAPMGLCCLCTDVECAMTPTLCNESMRTHFCFRTGAAGSICAVEEGAAYDGWSVGASSPFYALRLSASGQGIAPAHLQLTTDTPITTDGTSVLQLVRTSGASDSGAAAAAALNVTGRVLFVPADTASSSGSSTAESSDAPHALLPSSEDPFEWMLLPSSYVSVSGHACDRVGTTADYFYSLASADECNAQNGACLHNQLADYRAADLAQIAQGGAGQYIATSLGTFSMDANPAQPQLRDAVQRTGGAELRWSAVADGIAYTPVPVPGLLDDAALTNTTGLRLVAVVRNPNVYAGLYYVVVGECVRASVLNCSTINSASACERAALVAGDNASSRMYFDVVSGAADDAGSTASCRIALRDSVGAELSATDVWWTVEATTTTPAPVVPKAELCRRCPFHDLRCLFSTVCEWQMLVWTLLALVVAWTPYTAVAQWRVVAELCHGAMRYVRR